MCNICDGSWLLYKETFNPKLGCLFFVNLYGNNIKCIAFKLYLVISRKLSM